MGIYFDLGRPIVGGWLQGGWVLHDPVRDRDLLWGSELGQEGAVLFAIDVDSGEVVEEHRIGCREFNATPDPETGLLWLATNHGLFQPGHLLLSWSPHTRQLTSHGFPPISGQRFAGTPLFASDGRIYIGSHPHGHLSSFDPSDGTWCDYGCLAPEPIIPGQHIWCYPHAETDTGEIVCGITRDPGAVVALDPRTGKTRILDESPPAPTRPAPTRDIQANFWLAADYSVDGEERQSDYKPRVATDICGLNPGPDGKIYGSTIISMHMFCFDPETRELEDLGRAGWSSGEIYDVIGFGDKVYLGSYGGGYWAVYDPSKPWDAQREHEGISPTANPRNFGRLGKDMNRPFEYAIGPDDRIYIACRANYRIPGGGLARFDPATEEIHVFRDEEQSVQSVTADSRFVYGGTSISGGRGCIETTTQGKLFLFDVNSARRLFECIPVPDAEAVTSLAVSSTSGLVYGSVSSGQLFAFDVDQRQVIERWEMRSKGTPLMGVPETYGVIHLTCGHDGDIYGVTQKDVFKLDVSTHRIHYLDQPPITDLYQIVEGKPGVFYIGARGHLLEYHLKDTGHYR
jgi:outer membrane protein assembly factor BamB